MNNNRECLEFWYFMYGPHVGILNVEKRSGAFSQVRWTTSDGKGYEWYHAQVNLQSSTSNPTQFDVCFSFLKKNNLFFLFFVLSSLLLKEYGQEIIVVPLLLMILSFLMVHVEHHQINVILILMIQFVVR
jgi:hypothetical protein